VGETTGRRTTAGRTAAGPAAAKAAARLTALVGDGDLPTRLLVLGVARGDGTIRAADAFPMAEACRRSPEQVRSCLRRLVAEGLFAREGVGQAAVYRPTEAGLATLGAYAERTRLALAEDRRGAGWDGRWHLAAFAVPEARRGARDALREHLGLLGGAAVHNGLYASPRPWGKEVAAAADGLGVAEHLTLATTDSLQVGGVGEPRELARRLWPIDRLAARYRGFLDRWGEVPGWLDALRRRGEPLADLTFLPGTLAMGLAYQACFDADPLLPPELLPRPWPGAEARALLVRSRRLALSLREGDDHPPLFRALDDLLANA
jgi:phenylacetic acid degradation operon negative regulatory protein